MVNQFTPSHDPSRRSEQKNTTAAKRQKIRRFLSRENAPRPISTTVNRPLAEVKNLLRDVNNYALFFENLEKVEALDEKKEKFSFRLEEEEALSMELTADFSNDDQLSWTSTDGLGFEYSIRVELFPAPAGRGTVVRMRVKYQSAVGKFAGLLEKLFGQDADVLSRKNLQRLKVFCEVGHVPTTQGQSSGRNETQSKMTKD